MHDLLYENQGALSQDDLGRYAEQLELDVDAFVEELKAGVYEERVQEDFLSSVNGTPTFFINGTRYDGPLEFDSMLAEIAEVGDFLDIQQSLESEDQPFRETFDRSRRGAPASGEAVRDRFSADEIFQRVTATADEEVERSKRLLFFSGLAAGLSVGATFLVRAALTAAYPQHPMGIGTLLYPVGFIIIVLGKFDSNTPVNSIRDERVATARNHHFEAPIQLLPLVLCVTNPSGYVSSGFGNALRFVAASRITPFNWSRVDLRDQRTERDHS